MKTSIFEKKNMTTLYLKVAKDSLFPNAYDDTILFMWPRYIENAGPVV